MPLPIEGEVISPGNYILLFKVITYPEDRGKNLANFYYNLIQDYVNEHNWKLVIVKNFVLDPRVGEYSYKIRAINIDASDVYGLKNYIYSQGNPKYVDLYYY